MARASTCLVACGLGAPLRGERGGARVESGGQAQRAAQVAVVVAPRRLGRDDRGQLVAQARAHRRVGDQLAVVAHARALRQRGGGLQREQPVAVVRLDHHLVAIGGAPAARRV